MTPTEFRTWLETSGIGCTDRQWQQVSGYHSLLVEWNTRINLVSRTMPPEKIWGELFADALAPLPAGLLDKGARCVDIGTGAGIPGILLAIFRPDLHLVLMDSLLKRTGFLDVSRGTLELENVMVVRGRAEELGRMPEYTGNYDYALFKAVAAAEVCMKLGGPFLGPEGRVLMYKGADIGPELDAARKKFPCYSYRIYDYCPVGGDRERMLVLAEKKNGT